MTTQELADIRGLRISLQVRRKEHSELLGDLVHQIERLQRGLLTARQKAGQRGCSTPTPVRSEEELRATLDRIDADETQRLKQQIQRFQSVLEGKLRL